MRPGRRNPTGARRCDGIRATAAAGPPWAAGISAGESSPRRRPSLRAAVARLTTRNPNPPEGEAHYQLGLALRHLGRDEEAYAAFYKATWNQAWQAAGGQALAELACRRGDWAAALDHLDRALLRANADNLKARDLRTLVLRRLGRAAEAEAALRETLALDPLDWWARCLRGEALACDTQVRLDLALDLRARVFTARRWASWPPPGPSPAQAPLPWLATAARGSAGRWGAPGPGGAICRRRHGPGRLLLSGAAGRDLHPRSGDARQSGRRARALLSAATSSTIAAGRRRRSASGKPLPGGTAGSRSSRATLGSATSM